MSVGRNERQAVNGVSRSLLGKPSTWIIGLSMLAVLALASPRKAWADNITEFNLASSGAGSIFSGDGDSFSSGSEITIDTTTGDVVSGDITVDNSVGATILTFTGAANFLDSPEGYDWWDGKTDFFITALPETFVNFTGCTSCFSILIDGATTASGSVSLTDAPKSAPEPSSILLLGSGLIGLMAFTLRRKQSA